MRRALLLFLTLVLGVAACGEDPGASDPTPSATASESEAAEPQASEDQGSQPVTAWFARMDPDTGFWVEPVTGETEPTEGVARAAMEFLFGHDPANPALTNLAQAEVLGVDRDEAILTVDVSDEIEATGHSSTEESAFAQQLAYTAAQFDGVRAVRLLVEGEPIEELWGHLDWSQPIGPEQFKETPITIEAPVWGETVSRGALTASGQANTFEATLAVRLLDPDGEVVEEQWITATSGSGTRGTWEHTFDSEIHRGGTWTIEAEEPDPSGGAEGRTPLIVRTEFHIP